MRYSLQTLVVLLGFLAGIVTVLDVMGSDLVHPKKLAPSAYAKEGQLIILHQEKR